MSGLAERRNRAALSIRKIATGGQDGGSTGAMSIKRLTGGQSIYDLYEVTTKLQELSNRSVFTVRKIGSTDGVEFVLKVREKGKGDSFSFRTITQRMMQIPQFRNVLSFEAVYEDDDRYYMVMEKCNAGELFSMLMEEDAISERECKRIMREILQAVDHIHSEGLLHRDIKPENVMLHRDIPQDPSSPKTVKLIDFDTSSKWDPKTPKTKSVIGTHGYIAPESYKGEYSPVSDLWSVGVIFYVLMTGEMPFDNTLFDEVEEMDNTIGRGIEAMEEVLKEQVIDWECQPWPEFPLARDLCQRLLAFNPMDRSPDAKSALNHPWLQ
jgi:serine/threonine protein kinase